MRTALTVECESGRPVLTCFQRAAAVVLLVAVVIAARTVGQPAIRDTTDLDGPWRATLDAQDKGEREGYFKPDFATEGWKEVNVPASFANVAPEIDRYEGVGWFRRSWRNCAKPM